MAGQNKELPIVPPFVIGNDPSLLHPLQTQEAKKINELERYPYLPVRIKNHNLIPIILKALNERGEEYDRPAELELPSNIDFIDETIYFRTSGKQVKSVKIIGYKSGSSFFTSDSPKEIIMSIPNLEKQDYYIENILKHFPPEST